MIPGSGRLDTRSEAVEDSPYQRSGLGGVVEVCTLAVAPDRHLNAALSSKTAALDSIS